MARQKGLLNIEGTVGGMTFYRTKDGNLVREKGGVSKERIANDPAFARTRENGAEFGGAGSSGKLLRDSIRPLMAGAADNRVTSRITQLMTQIQKYDTTSARGKRNVGTAAANATAKALLKNFNFNKDAILGAVLFKAIAVDTGTGEISILGVVPANDINFPSGATHAKISAGVANINFTSGETEVKYTNEVSIALDANSTDVTLTPAELPAGTGTVMYFLKVEFLQLINGIQYGLKNGAYNALAIIEVA